MHKKIIGEASVAEPVKFYAAPAPACQKLSFPVQASTIFLLQNTGAVYGTGILEKIQQFSWF
jgi:hypothetical protein